MKGVNKVILVGRLGQNPDVRYTQEGNAVCTFSVATTDAWIDKKDMNQKAQTEWHNCVAFRRTAEICGEYLEKGSLVYVEGSNRTRSWDDKETGRKVYKTEVIVNNIQFLDSKGEGNNNKKPYSAPGNGAVKQLEEDEIPF